MQTNTPGQYPSSCRGSSLPGPSSPVRQRSQCRRKWSFVRQVVLQKNVIRHASNSCANQKHARENRHLSANHHHSCVCSALQQGVNAACMHRAECQCAGGSIAQQLTNEKICTRFGVVRGGKFGFSRESVPNKRNSILQFGCVLGGAGALLQPLQQPLPVRGDDVDLQGRHARAEVIAHGRLWQK